MQKSPVKADCWRVSDGALEQLPQHSLQVRGLIERLLAVDVCTFVIEGLDSLVGFRCGFPYVRAISRSKATVYTLCTVPKRLGTGTGFAGAKKILRPVGPQDASLARRLSEILPLRSRCSLRPG